MTILPPHDKVNANLTNSLYQVPLYLSIARPAKNPKASPRGFLPRPLLRAGNQSRGFAKSFPQKIVLAKPSPH